MHALPGRNFGLPGPPGPGPLNMIRGHDWAGLLILSAEKKIPGGAIEVDPILPELFFEENVTVNSSICIVKKCF